MVLSYRVLEVLFDSESGNVTIRIFIETSLVEIKVVGGWFETFPPYISMKVYLFCDRA